MLQLTDNNGAVAGNVRRYREEIRNTKIMITGRNLVELGHSPARLSGGFWLLSGQPVWTGGLLPGRKNDPGGTTIANRPEGGMPHRNLISGFAGSDLCIAYRRC